MTGLLFALMLMFGAPSAGTVGTGATYLPTVYNTCTNAAAGTTTSCSANIPVNGIVLVWGTVGIGPFVTPATTSASITYTNQGIQGDTILFTGINNTGSVITGESIQFNSGASATNTGIMVVTVLNGKTTALTNQVKAADAVDTSLSTSISAVGSSSLYFVGTMQYSGLRTFAPNAGTTEDIESTMGTGDAIVVIHNTTPAGGTITLSGTWSSSSGGYLNGIEIQAP